ncbi:two component transcriptional regulator, winged helix family [Methylobacterium sp. 4-46]|uniref:response regulator n=1 Tax=unclassified Methylobacterium TaxID=2615210 RepID=UPI000165C5AB|nr:MULTISPECIES: response regulator transcription factor [Methylobacterium]ACA17945.1 two component transcriptional regulator, winged helix family [Methylobacterium sp. 4-46]WFT77246.1 response regulator transcription factor [Methylobacterium nodulans]
MAERLLLIDDDRRLAAMVAEYLSAEGYAVACQPTAREGHDALRRERFDAVILDVMLPDGDGFELCRQIRTHSRVPILMLTAKGEDTDRIIGLEIGADDYLPKPFNPRELLARIRALLRRQRAPQEARLDFGRLQIDPGSRVVRLDGVERRLTSHQFDLLLAFATHAGRVLSRERLMDLVKGEDLDAFDRSIDVHVSRLRALIEDDPRHPRRLLTIRGAGYVFAREQDAER